MLKTERRADVKCMLGIELYWENNIVELLEIPGFIIIQYTYIYYNICYSYIYKVFLYKYIFILQCKMSRPY